MNDTIAAGEMPVCECSCGKGEDGEAEDLSLEVVNSNDMIESGEMLVRMLVRECSWCEGEDGVDFSLEVVNSSSPCSPPDDACDNNSNICLDNNRDGVILSTTTATSAAVTVGENQNHHIPSPPSSNSSSIKTPLVQLEKENHQQQYPRVGLGTSPGLTREFLQAAASVSFRHRSEMLNGKGKSSSMPGDDEMRTTVSSGFAGTGSSMSYPLRERLLRLSRSQRKELLVRPDFYRSPIIRSPYSGNKDHQQQHHRELRHPTNSPTGSTCDDDDDEKFEQDEGKNDSDSDDTRDPGIAESPAASRTTLSPPPPPLPPPPPPPPPTKSSPQVEVVTVTSLPSSSVTEHTMSSTSWTSSSTIPYDDELTDLINTHNGSAEGGEGGSGEGGGLWLEMSGKPNDIKLHIYDLIAKDTLMQLPWGCVWEIGKCFNDVNTALHELGTGAYHVGVEINGVEYAYGAASTPGRSGVFTCIPKLSPGYQYRTTIDFGKRPMIRKTWVLVEKREVNAGGKPSTSFRQKIEYVDGREIVKDMASEYMGLDYDIFRRNCCTFARDACLRLGIPEREIPSWFRNLAESGAMTQDLARATALPIAMVFSSEAPTSVVSDTESDDGNSNIEEEEEHEGGFEIVARRHDVSGRKDDLVVVLASERQRAHLRYAQSQWFQENGDLGVLINSGSTSRQ